MAKKTVYREDEKIRFVNPYNFVSLGEDVRREKVQKGTLSGKIKCTLITKNTPLAIPDHETLQMDDKEHKTMGFFSVAGVPVIPGSEIRGLIRSDYETVRNGCLSVNNNNILSSRNTFPKRPGILEYKDGEWVLYEARKSKNEVANSVERKWLSINGEPTTFYFVKMDQKKIDCCNMKKAVENYEYNLEYYGKNPEFSKYIQPLKKDSPNAVFFDLITGMWNKVYLYLTPAQISRSVFDNRLDDLLKTHKKCTDSENLCEACALFGMIGEGTDGGAKASSVRFTDAVLSDGQKDVLIREQTLQELASPKITSLEYYTNRPQGAKFWSYDYKVTGYGEGRDARGRKFVFPKYVMLTESEKKTLINGRKYYLHSAPHYETVEKTKRNLTLDLCKKDTEFSFDVYFDRITDKQLSRLAWVLCLGDNDSKSGYLHKLGHGKPLGLGSVKILVDEILVRRVDNNRYSVDTENVAEVISRADIRIDTKTMREYMRAKQFDNTENCPVRYPLAENLDARGANATAAHQWFTANRAMGEGATSMKWNIKHVLPKLEEDLDALQLPKILISKEDTGTYQGSISYGGKGNGATQGKNRQGFGRNENVLEEKIRVTCSVCGKSCLVRKSVQERYRNRVKCWNCMNNK